MGSGGSNCPFYQSYKYCIKAGREINDDLFDYYCMLGYSYTDCPIYKGTTSSSSSGGCFITSACVESKGLPDDCYELTTLRWYRDNILSTTSCGKEKIAEYYNIAPQIVESINLLQNKSEIYDEIYSEYILKCIKTIEDKKYDATFDIYCHMVDILKEKYLKGD